MGAAAEATTAFAKLLGLFSWGGEGGGVLFFLVLSLLKKEKGREEGGAGCPYWAAL